MREQEHSNGFNSGQLLCKAVGNFLLGDFFDFWKSKEPVIKRVRRLETNTMLQPKTDSMWVSCFWV